jgi:serine protease
VVVVGYAPPDTSSARAAIARAAGAVDPVELESHTRLLTLAPHASVPGALARLRHTPGVAWAVPDYIAHAAVMPASHATAVSAAAASPPAGASLAGASPLALAAPASALTGASAAAAPGVGVATAAGAGQPFPNDPGLAKVPGGWSQLQWNFVGEFGVEAPGAWRNLIADHAAGGRGVIVAVLDTGVAYANRRRFRISPDFYHYQFVAGWDFIAHNRYPNDRNGHGTDVAGTIAEATNNGRGLTGLAYGVHIMPVRVLNGEGNGDAATIAKGVRFAVNHGARVINLSLEFPGGITASDIPELISALRYANRHGVVVVAAAGNPLRRRLPRPRPQRDRGGRHHRTRVPRLLLQLRRRRHPRGPRGRARRQPPRRPQLPPRTPLRARRLPGHLPRRLPAALRDPGRV